MTKVCRVYTNAIERDYHYEIATAVCEHINKVVEDRGVEHCQESVQELLDDFLSQNAQQKLELYLAWEALE